MQVLLITEMYMYSAGGLTHPQVKAAVQDFCLPSFRIHDLVPLAPLYR